MSVRGFRAPFHRAPVFAVIAVSAVSGLFLVSTVARASGASLTNLRADERRLAIPDEGGGGGGGRPSHVVLYRVESPSATCYYLNEEQARDAVLAYALRDECASMTVEEVPYDSVFVEEDGSVEVLAVGLT